MDCLAHYFFRVALNLYMSNFYNLNRYQYIYFFFECNISMINFLALY